MIFSAEGVATLISAGIAACISWIVAKITIERNDKSILENELTEILKIGIERPYLEQVAFTEKWKPELQESDDRYATYDLYATLVFNYLEKVCKFYGFNYEKVQKVIDMDSWVKLHKAYWHNPTGTFENILGYDPKFYNLVNNVILKGDKKK